MAINPNQLQQMMMAQAANAPQASQPQQPPMPMQGAGGPPQDPGSDPYNSNQGGPPPMPAANDDVAGSVPANTDPGHAAIIRAMHNAYSNKGVNPYNSHPEQAKKWERAWKDRANRDAIKAAGGMKSGADAIHPAEQNKLQRINAGYQSYGFPGMSGALPIKR